MIGSLKKRKEILLIICIFALLVSGLGVFFLTKNKEVDTTLTSEWDISWYDENEDEFVITTKEELFGFADLSKTIDFADKTIKLGNDIVINEGNAVDWSKKAPKLLWTPVLNFAGTFDGQGHSVSGLYANVTSGGAGMFADTQEDSVIKNFRLINTYIYSQTSKGTGSIASGGSGTIEYIYTDAIVECNGFFCGGIVGNLKDDASIQECWFDGAIKINGSCAGGIAASANDGKTAIHHCLNTGTVTSTYPGPDAAIIGGIIGSITKKINITDTLNVGTVVSEAELEQVGGLIGMLSGGTAKIDALWTANDVAPDRVGYAKSGFEGAYGDCRLDQMIGVKAYQKMNLDFDKHWAIVEDGTPVLQHFAETVPEIPEGLERAYFADVSWFNIKYNEFVISTPEELLGLARLTEMGEGYGNRFTKKKVKLANDIVFNTEKATTYETNEPLNEWIPIYNFTGTFDGQGHTISGLYAVGNETTKTGTGFFAYSREMTIIENLKITNSYFSTRNVYGLSAVVGRGGGTIRNVYADAILKTTDKGNIGGIFGFATRIPVHIENCWSDCDITSGARRVGGILGNGNGRTDVEIKHCLNTGKLTRSFKGLAADDSNRRLSSLFGGIVGGTGGGNKEKGYTGSFLIEDCFNSGLITSEREKDGIGGVIGTATGKTAEGTPTVTVKNSYCSESSCERVIGGKNPDTVVIDVNRLPDEMVTGAEAYFYTALNFKQYWTALNGKTPVLKMFAAGKGKALAVSGERVDTSWFKPGKKEFTIKTAAQLYGFTMLAYSGEKFEGVTIKLGADIVINSGNASEWAEGKNVPARSWTPIKNFAGTFDGQGHTISGLYGFKTGVHEKRGGLGLFTDTKETATIQNVSIANTYFESTYANGVGAVAARSVGTFKNIYVGSDVYIKNKVCGAVGGLIGIATKDTYVENCWSAANVTSAGQEIGGIIGNGNAMKVTVKHCLFTGTVARSFEGHEEGVKLYDYAEYPSYYKKRSEVGAYLGGIIGRTGSGTEKAGFKGDFVIEDCLSTGTISSVREKDYIGGVVGYATGSTADGKATVTITNSYTNATNCKRAVGIQFTGAVLADCIPLKDYMLVGAESYYYTLLDFNNYWVAIQGGTPVLKAFATSSDAVVAVGGKRADTSWYTNGEPITDADDLFGLMKLSLQGRSFSKETIKLGATFDVNTGSAADWAENKNVPTRSWTPIQNFAGVFDGQGYSIKGLYGVATGNHAERAGMGLFVETRDTATIQNFTIENSYFESTYANGLAAVSGRGGGNFKKIHISGDVYLKNKINGSVGSIVGIATKETHVENCWSEAKITSAGQGVAGILGNGNAQTVTIKHCLNTGTLTRSFAGLEEALKLYDYASYPSYYKNTSTVAGYFGGIIGRTGGGNSTAYKGKFVIEDCVHVGTLTSEREGDANGGIAGHTTGLTEGGEATVTIKNAYCTQSSCEKIIGSKNAKTEITSCTLHVDDKMVGVNAFYNTDLDFKDFWSVRKNTTPMLTSFLTTTDEIIDVSGLSKDEFKINSNNQGFIASAGQLESFRDQLNDGSLAVNQDTIITLTADIVVNEGKATDWAKGKNVPAAWIPINGFTGTFDGDGHTISGLFVNGADGFTGRGLFTKTNGATIQNLKVTNSFYKGNSSTGTGAIVGQGNGTFRNIYTDVIMIDTASKGALGGIIGNADGNVTVSNCWTASDITSNKNYAGGILGTVTASGYTITIEHCLNTGDLTYTGKGNSYFGGLVGRANVAKPTGGLLTVQDSMSVGVVSGTTKQTYMGGLLGFASKVVDNQETTVVIDSYCATYTTGIDVAIGNDNRTNKTGATAVAYNDLKGELALTNANGLDYKSDSNTEGFWITRTDKTPMLTYFLALSDEIDAAEEADKTFVLVDNKGTISNLTQLEDFRDKMNAGELSVNQDTVITLTADIEMNEGWTANVSRPAYEWIPIVGYPGTFDGGGKTISAVYVRSNSGIVGIGLFTETEETTVIKNLNVTNSHFRGNSSNGTGAIVGKGSGTFQNIFVQAEVYDSHKKGNLGGILGVASGTVLVENCWSDCEIEANNVNLGGIVGNGNAKEITIKHCMSTSNITISSTCEASNAYAGGIIGKTGGGSGTADKPYTGNILVENCLAVGIVKTESANTTKALGGIVGYATGLKEDETATVTIKNSYSAINYDGENSVGATVAIGVDKGAAIENSEAVDYDKLKGELALVNASGLDYVSATNTDAYWITRENNVPMLVFFASGKE